MSAEPESRLRACWYGRRTASLPADLSIHTIEDGYLLYCAHPMWFPIVGYRFDVRNCTHCEFFKPAKPTLAGGSTQAGRV
jgi:hypothetical protein